MFLWTSTNAFTSTSAIDFFLETTLYLIQYYYILVGEKDDSIPPAKKQKVAHSSEGETTIALLSLTVLHTLIFG